MKLSSLFVVLLLSACSSGVHELSCREQIQNSVQQVLGTMRNDTQTCSLLAKCMGQSGEILLDTDRLWGTYSMYSPDGTRRTYEVPTVYYCYVGNMKFELSALQAALTACEGRKCDSKGGCPKEGKRSHGGL